MRKIFFKFCVFLRKSELYITMISCCRARAEVTFIVGFAFGWLYYELIFMNYRRYLLDIRYSTHKIISIFTWYQISSHQLHNWGSTNNSTSHTLEASPLTMKFKIGIRYCAYSTYQFHITLVSPITDSSNKRAAGITYLTARGESQEKYRGISVIR